MSRRAPADGYRAGVVLLAGALGLLAAARVRAQQPVASSQCCYEVLLPIGAVSVALGRSTVALGGPEAVFSNPAGLAELSRAQFSIHHRDEVDGQLNGLSLLLHPKGIGTLGLTYELDDEGSTEITQGPAGSLGTLYLQAHTVYASFATSLGGAIDAGISYKLFIFATSCGSCSDLPTGATQLFDVGIQVRPPQVPGLELGASLVNAGLPLQFVNYEQSDGPPHRLRLGAAYEVLHLVHPDTILALRLSAQVEAQAPAPRPNILSAGAEFSVANAIFLRMGYNGAPGSVDPGLAMGVGFRYDRFTLAVAKSFSSTPLEPQGAPPHLSFGIEF